MAFMLWVEMLHDEERHPRVWGHVGEQGFECSKAASRGSNPNYDRARHATSERRLPFRIVCRFHFRQWPDPQMPLLERGTLRGACHV